MLILGPSKTGTTGVYTSVRNAYRDAGHEIRSFFEPKKTEYVDNVFRLGGGVPVLIKVTMPEKIGFDPLAFDRRIMTVRDPRDTVISTLLFRPLINRVIRRGDDAAIETFVAALRRKEADPASISVRELFDVAASVGIGGTAEGVMRGVIPKQISLMRELDFHVVKYEDFVVDELAGLSEYLGVSVRNVSAGSSTFFGHIARSGTHGDFLRWFRADDLEFFNELFRDGIEEFGYPLDVELDPSPVIDPATASEYVSSRYQQRRQQLKSLRSREWEASDVDTQEKYDELIDAAVNGDPVACERAVQVALGPQLGGRDEAAALHWAIAAAELGSVSAMRTAAKLWRAVSPPTPQSVREARGWQLEHRLRTAASPASSDRQVRELENELAAMQASARYRLGNQMVRAAQNPRRNAVPALREVLAMYRARKR